MMVDNVRDRAIIAMFTESGLRLSELVNICPRDIDRQDQTIRVLGKGRKEALAPLGKLTRKYLDELSQTDITREAKVDNIGIIGDGNIGIIEDDNIRIIKDNNAGELPDDISRRNIWHLNKWGIVSMLRRLEKKCGYPCNPHVFRRTFACLLRKVGLDVMTIKDLGRWETLDMVQRYTRTVTFQDSLKFYKSTLSDEET